MITQDLIKLQTIMKIQKTLLQIIMLLFIVLWTYAALSKVSEFEIFRYQLGQSPGIAFAAPFLAWWLPLAELTMAIMFIFERTRIYAFYLSFIAMVVFTVYLIGMLIFASKIPCSCGGLISKLTWTQHIYFNLLFVAMGIIGLLILRNNSITPNSKHLNLNSTLHTK